jgi:hypothetical protein
MGFSNDPYSSIDESGRLKDVLFVSIEGGYGIEIFDRIDRHQYLLWTPNIVSPEEIDNSRISSSVDAAVSITTNAITLPTVVPVHIRDETGSYVSSVEQSSSKTFSQGVYHLELFAPIELYLQVEGAITVSSSLTQTYIDFGDETEVLIGACSDHEQPTAVVTTTDDPQDMIATISTFASALKTQSPERSFPSNRGHPPVVKLGQELHIPTNIEHSDSDIRLEIPANYRSIYAAAPLVYYLGADVVPAETPKLVTESGFQYTLGTGGQFEKAVEKILKQVFFLDCIVRTEGAHPIDLHERQAVEPYLDYDLTSLYDCPPAERLEAYFDTPFSVIEPHIPDWMVTAHVDPEPEHVEILPFISHRLAVVRTSRGQEISPTNERKALINEFLRNGDDTQYQSGEEVAEPYIQPELNNSLENIWIGNGIPLGASKALLKAYQNRLGRQPTEDDIDVTVVYNDIDLSSPLVDVDLNMNHERDIVDEVYGSRSDFPFEITIHQDLTVEELRLVLQAPTDFLHYIGHIDDEGIQCTDGVLDAATLDTVGMDAFFLNACRSYRQGYHLVQAGSIGGIATLGDLVDNEAVKMGQTVARLLNRGFPLYAAHEIARETILLGGQYIVVGDGGFSIVQAESSVVNMCEIKSANDSYEVKIKTYPTGSYGMGTVFIPYIESNNEYYLIGGLLDTFKLSTEEVQQFLLLEDIPIQIEGKLRWSHDINIVDL